MSPTFGATSKNGREIDGEKVAQNTAKSTIFSIRSLFLMVGCIASFTMFYILKNGRLRHEADMIGKMRCILYKTRYNENSN
jgi:hypothetical protein